MGPSGRTFERYPLAEVWAGGCRQPRASVLRWTWEQGQGQAPVTRARAQPWVLALGGDQMGRGEAVGPPAVPHCAQPWEGKDQDVRLRPPGETGLERMGTERFKFCSSRPGLGAVLIRGGLSVGGGSAGGGGGLLPAGNACPPPAALFHGVVWTHLPAKPRLRRDALGAGRLLSVGVNSRNAGAGAAARCRGSRGDEAATVGAEPTQGKDTCSPPSSAWSLTLDFQGVRQAVSQRTHDSAFPALGAHALRASTRGRGPRRGE